MYSNLTEAALLDLLKSDARSAEQAFTEIYNRFSEKLFGVAYSRVKDMQASEDIVHEALLSLWNKRRHTVVGSLDAYLATTAKYLSISYLRTGRRVQFYDNESMPEGSDSLNAEQIYQTKHLVALLRSEVDKLPEQCRLIFQYSKDQDWSVKEIAEQLDLSPLTVKNQLYRAMLRLRRMLKATTSLLATLF